MTCIPNAPVGGRAARMNLGSQFERRLRERISAVSPEVMRRIGRQREALAKAMEDLVLEPDATPTLAGRLAELRHALRDHFALVDAVFDALQDDGEPGAEPNERE